ncbi:helix-turn-helix transcriptional regulator [Streptantibioticus ferralitis]|uniref:LuxR C-terminal-related transcriptional regulator n=1 Tax=Streptantibioticus ferralitis TaxID=236510 RepID=A0ABT5YRU3_9ACTN|nr:LuxR C-terminal-related transcriptional regulator [Streptantibioticus ferralitis]MDF2254306.1 LuxR C-terminal-related transcriptional regulator [Streptantibioticus ferralitis]
MLLGPDSAPPALQPLTDSDALATVLDTMRIRRVRELRLALPRRPCDRLVREQAVQLSAELAGRGAQVRVLHLGDADRDPAYADDTRRIAASGARMRMLPHLPVWMAVADRDLAIVLPDPGFGDSSATLLRGPILVGAYQALFDQVWALSTPSADVPGDATRAAERGGLNTREREALVLLAEGLTDEGISRRTGLSVRTIRRTIAGVMAKVEAQSRFQAGAEVVRRQWI